jgi:hypothetical protein
VGHHQPHDWRFDIAFEIAPRLLLVEERVHLTPSAPRRVCPHHQLPEFPGVRDLVCCEDGYQATGHSPFFEDPQRNDEQRRKRDAGERQPSDACAMKSSLCCAGLLPCEVTFRHAEVLAPPFGGATTGIH